MNNNEHAMQRQQLAERTNLKLLAFSNKLSDTSHNKNRFGISTSDHF